MMNQRGNFQNFSLEYFQQEKNTMNNNNVPDFSTYNNYEILQPRYETLNDNVINNQNIENWSTHYDNANYYNFALAGNQQKTQFDSCINNFFSQNNYASHFGNFYSHNQLSNYNVHNFNNEPYHNEQNIGYCNGGNYPMYHSSNNYYVKPSLNDPYLQSEEKSNFQECEDKFITSNKIDNEKENNNFLPKYSPKRDDLSNKMILKNISTEKKLSNCKKYRKKLPCQIIRPKYAHDMGVMSKKNISTLFLNILHVILATKNKKLMILQIYDKLKKYASYKENFEIKWKSSIRNCLSTNECFLRLKRVDKKEKHSHLWTVDTSKLLSKYFNKNTSLWVSSNSFYPLNGNKIFKLVRECEIMLQLSNINKDQFSIYNPVEYEIIPNTTKLKNNIFQTISDEDNFCSNIDINNSDKKNLNLENNTHWKTDFNGDLFVDAKDHSTPLPSGLFDSIE